MLVIKVLKQEIQKVSAAFSFLTVFPLPFGKDITSMSAYFPLVGWFLGSLLLILNGFLSSFPPAVRAFLIVFFWEFFSCFLHLDALADAADAFLRGGKREDLLRIMSDSKVGSFGISAVTLHLIGKFALVFSLNHQSSFLALLGAALFSRYLLAVISFVFSAAKNKGLGWLVSSTTGFKELAVATFWLLPAVFVFQSTILPALLSLIFPFLMAWFMVKKVAGLTGDILGAALEVSELFVLFFFLLFLKL